jgi:hypothetical protein
MFHKRENKKIRLKTSKIVRKENESNNIYIIQVVIEEKQFLLVLSLVKAQATFD